MNFHIQNLKNPRVLIMLFMGFSSGLPFALTSSTLQAWFTQSGINVVVIGALSLIGLPYAWKFLWSPVIDRFVPPWLGRRRGWICITQLGLCLTLFLLAGMNPRDSMMPMIALAVGIAFFSASQDIAIDAYRTDVLQPKEYGLGSAAFVFSYRMAMLISGGVALIIADYVGWQLTYQILALLLATLVIATYFAPETSSQIQAPKDFKEAVVEPFKDLLQREGIVLTLLFIVFYKLGVVFALALMSNFLLRGLDFSLTDVGVAFKIFGLLATILGAFVGGMFTPKMGLYRCLLWFGIGQAFSNLMFMFLAVAGKNYALMVTSIFIEQFFSGMTAVAFMAFLMTLCHHKYSATQYACLSALFAIVPALIGPIAGVIVKHIGWIQFFGWSFILSFPGILLLGLLRKRVTFDAKPLPA